LRRPDIFWLDAHSVVDCDAQLLLATEVTLCCLDRDVSKEELDLVQFAASEVIRPGATATKVMRCKFVYARPRGGLPIGVLRDQKVTYAEWIRAFGDRRERT
jgi:hypothetical protein